MNLNASEERRLSSARVVLLAVVFVLVGSTCYSQVPGRGRKSGSRHQQSAGQLMALSADGTHLVNTFTNQPVFMVGEDAFAMDGNLSSADLETYLSDRASRGFNLIWISAVDNVYSVNPPKDYPGNLPFSGGDFLNMQEPYFAELDYVIQRGVLWDHGPAQPGVLWLPLQRRGMVPGDGSRLRCNDDGIWNVPGESI